MSLNCIVAMVDRLQGREQRPLEVTSAEQHESPTNAHNSGETVTHPHQSVYKQLPSKVSGSDEAVFLLQPPPPPPLPPLPPRRSSWQEQLLPLVVTLRDCVREAVAKARAAMTFVVLQGAVAPTVAQGPAHIVQRRHAVFSQAVRAA